MPSPIFEDRFEVRQRLGSGGFGEVFRVYDRKHDLEVALKRLHHSSPQALALFKNEFRSLCEITHPNLVALYELICGEDDWMVTMELVRGRSLLQYVFPESGAVGDETELTTLAHGSSPEPTIQPKSTASSLDLERFLAIGRQLVEAVGCIHGASKLHLDIKPSNVMVEDGGRLVLLDFGLVTPLLASGRTQDAVSAGSPAYMAPEQFGGETVTAAADLYAVGVVIYEMLTGTLPFTGSASDVMLRKMQHAPTHPSELNSRIPPALANVVFGLLNPRSESRPSLAGLRSILEGLHHPQPAASSLALSAPHTAPTFVGREEQLDQLASGLSDVIEQGRAKLMVVSAEPGGGKSRLLSQFLTSVPSTSANTIIVRGRCFDRESVPFNGLDVAMGELVRELATYPIERLNEVLPRRSAALLQLFPAFARLIPRSPTDDYVLAADREALRDRAFAELVELLRNLTERVTLVLALDDVQWASRNTLTLSRYLIAALEQSPVLLMLATRPMEEDGGDLEKFFRVDESEPVEWIHLPALSDDESLQLAKAVSADDIVASAHWERILRDTGGNPFFLSEVLRYGSFGEEESSVGGLDSLLRRRVAKLDGPLRSIVDVLAVAHRSIPMTLLDQACGGPSFPHLVKLSAQHVTRTYGASADQVGLYHDHIRIALLDSMDEVVEKETHAALADAVLAGEDPNPEFLYPHLAGAGRLVQAAEYALMAGERAMTGLAFAQAAHCFEEAVQFDSTLDTAELNQQIGKALAGAGLTRAAAESYLKAADAEDATWQIQLTSRSQAAQQLFSCGRVEAGTTQTQLLMRSAGLPWPGGITGLLGGVAATKLRGLFPARRSATESPISAELDAKLDAAWAAAMGLSTSLMAWAGYYQIRYEELAQKSGHPTRLAHAQAFKVGRAAFRTSPRARHRTQQILERFHEAAVELNDPSVLSAYHFSKGMAGLLSTEWGSALDAFDTAVEILTTQGDGSQNAMLAVAEAHGHECRYLGGRWRDLPKLLPAAIEQSRNRNDWWREVCFTATQVMGQFLVSNQPERAEEVLRNLEERWPDSDLSYLRFMNSGAWLELAFYRSRPSRIMEQCQQFKAHGKPLGLGWSALGRALMTNQFGRAWLLRASSSKRPKSELRKALRCAKRLKKIPLAQAQANYLSIAAGIAAVQRRTEDASSLLEQLETAYTNSDNVGFSALARFRRGQLLGGEIGAQLVDTAQVRLREQGVVNPDRFAGQILPPRQWLG